MFLERLFEHTFDMPLTESTYTDVFQMLLCLINIENCKTVAQLKETSANINKILTNYGIFIDMLSLNVPFPSESKENILKQLYAYHILYVHDFATLDTDFEFKVEKTVRGYPKLIDYIDTFLKSSEWYEPFCFLKKEYIACILILIEPASLLELKKRMELYFYYRDQENQTHIQADIKKLLQDNFELHSIKNNYLPQFKHSENALLITDYSGLLITDSDVLCIPKSLSNRDKTILIEKHMKIIQSI